MAKQVEKRGLGRGLSALLADVNADLAVANAEGGRRGELLVPIERLFPNPDQPRRSFDPAALADLAASIRTKGVIQPLIVREKKGDPLGYEIVAGERRWRAAQIAQVHELPVLVRKFDDVEVLEVAIIENIQRADLNAIDEAQAYRQLIERFGHTQEKVAEALSRSRSHIANLLRLLTLPAEIQQFVKEGALSAGHARALITAPDPADLAKQIIAKGLSVREAEALARKRSEAPTDKKKPRQTGSSRDADTLALEADLTANLSMPVRIDHAAVGEGGKLTISYRSLDDLDLLCSALSLISRDMAV